MDMDTPEPSRPIVPAVEAAPPAAPPRVKRPVITPIVAVIALLVAGAALWQSFARDRADVRARTDVQLLQTEVDGLKRADETARRERETARQRLADSENVNKSLREELLAVSERARVVEDAIANLAQRRVSGHDAMLLDEAELVLLLGQERLELFDDVDAARRAFRLADAALVSVGDPAFATTRETLAAELRDLEQWQTPVAGATIAELERIRGSLAGLPAAPTPGDAARGDEPKWWRVLGQFVRVSRVDDASGTARERPIARGLVALDVRAAELSLAERDTAAFRKALARVRAQVLLQFDAEDARVRDVVAAIDRLGPSESPAPRPQLGATLKELRRLRSVADAATPPAPTADAGATP